MPHAHEGNVGSARVVVTVDKKLCRRHVVNPHSGAFGPFLGVYALHGATRNQIFFEHAGVKLGQRVFGGQRRLFVVFGTIGAVSAHYGFHQRTDKIVGDRMRTGSGGVVAFAHRSSGVVGHKVAPLVAEGVSHIATPVAQQRRHCRHGLLYGRKCECVSFKHNVMKIKIMVCVGQLTSASRSDSSRI